MSGDPLGRLTGPLAAAGTDRALAARPVLLELSSGVKVLPMNAPLARWLASSHPTAFSIAASAAAGRDGTAASWLTTNAVVSVSWGSVPSTHDWFAAEPSGVKKVRK